MKNKTSLAVIITVLVLVGIVVLGRDKIPGKEIAQTANTLPGNEEVISPTGIHWHPKLTIIINGKETPIPANIGIGMRYANLTQFDSMMTMTDMHTHDDSGTLHWEIMEGPVRKEDVRLSNFFSVWGKKLDNNCVFEYCNGPEGRLTFKVNGEENFDFENYLVKDADKIDIIFLNNHYE